MKLSKDDFELFDASGESIETEAIRTYLLELSFSNSLKLVDRYYMTKIIKNIISIPLLLE